MKTHNNGQNHLHVVLDDIILGKHGIPKLNFIVIKAS